MRVKAKMKTNKTQLRQSFTFNLMILVKKENNMNQEKIASKIKELRKERGLTQKHLAELNFPVIVSNEFTSFWFVF